MCLIQMKKITQVHLIIAVNETKATSKEDVSLFHQGKLEFNSEIKCSLIMPGKGRFYEHMGV